MINVLLILLFFLSGWPSQVVEVQILSTADGTLRMAVIEWAGTADALTSDVVGTWGTGNPTLATSWSYIGTPAAITISGSRTRYKVENLTVGASTNNLAVFIWTDATEDTGDLWNVARVQLERGPVATEFVARSMEEELVLVSSLFVKSYDLGTTPGTNTGVGAYRYQTRTAIAGTTAGTLPQTIILPVRMRRIPTITLYSNIGTSGAVRLAIAGVDRTGATNATASQTGFNGISISNASANAINLDEHIIFQYVCSARQ